MSELRDLEAERAIIASVLIKPEILPDLLRYVDARDFSEVRHERVFAALVRLFSEHEPIDAITLTAALRDAGDLETVGAAYVAELTASLATPAAAPAYARIVHDLALRRDFGRAAAGLAAYSREAASAEELFAEAHRELNKIYVRQISNQTSRPELLRRALDRMINPKPGAYWSTGLHSFDRALGGGLERGDLIVVAAQTNKGKSTLALNVAAAFARRGEGAIFFSCEMPEEKLWCRLFCAEAHVPLILRGDDLSSPERERLEHAALTFAEKPLDIQYAPGLSPLRLRAAAERFQLEYSAPLRLIVADYIGLMNADAKEERHEREIASISRQLKLIAGELDCAVLACAQLNREVDRREGCKPRLADLRDSGAIEQNADIVTFIYHDPKKPRGKDCSLVIAKDRDGTRVTVPIAHVADETRFEDLPLAGDEEPDAA